MFWLSFFSDEVLKSLSPQEDGEQGDQAKRATLDQHNSIVEQYKELIREQVRIENTFFHQTIFYYYNYK